MALVEMQRLYALVMKRDQAALVQMVQRAGCVQITPVGAGEAHGLSAADHRLQRNEEALHRVRWAISRLNRYDPVKQSMFKPLPVVEPAALEEEDLSAAISVVEQVEELERQSGELRGQHTRLEQMAEQLQPWVGLDVPANQIHDTATTRVWTGYAPQRGLHRLIEEWKGRPAVISMLGSQRDSAAFYAVVHNAYTEAFLSDLRAIGYQHAAPLLGQETPAEQMKRIARESGELRAQEANIEKRMANLGVSLPVLRLAYENLAARKGRLDALGTMTHTQSVSVMAGWVPKAAAQPLADAIIKAFPGAQAMVRDPLEEEDPPILLHNHPVVRPYEAVISGFSLPANGALDPTAVMMPFFAIFFGMMVSDAGYGLVMALLIPILVKIMQPSEGARKIFWIIAGGGVSTVLWGALYNTWFGFGPWPSLFDPVNNSLPVMALCIGVGALHLFTGLILGAVQNFRRGDPFSALYDQFSWILLVIGLGLLLLPQAAQIGKWMAVLGAGIILLTAGREKSKNPIKRLVSGFGALYGVTSWISDLLSYMRLFGMGLATGVIGMVINQLVGMLAGGGILGIIFGAVVFVGAHLFNAAINILGAYVHACRLQYIEFFGKFYEEGGKPFKPLRFAPRYVRLHE
jgi:V/A-type H+-transporting ATPase subunit I